MHDETDGRLWQAHHAAFTAAAGDVAALIGAGLSQLTARAMPLLSALLLGAVLATATIAAAETAAIMIFTQEATHA